MAISLNSDITSVLDRMNASTTSGTRAATLESKLSNIKQADDKELMEVCKSFEAYLVEQVLTNLKKAIVPESEDDQNEYMQMFGDRLYQEYANIIAQSGQLGIAKQLYDSLANQNTADNKITDTEG